MEINCQQCVMIHIGKICLVDTAIKNVKIIDHTVGLAISWASTFVCYSSFKLYFPNNLIFFDGILLFSLLCVCRLQDKMMMHVSDVDRKIEKAAATR